MYNLPTTAEKSACPYGSPAKAQQPGLAVLRTGEKGRTMRTLLHIPAFFTIRRRNVEYIFVK